jgi:hypothetical protein
VSRSCVMSLIITFMFEPAKLQMNWASASGARNLRRAEAEVDAVALTRPYAHGAGKPPEFRGQKTAAIESVRSLVRLRERLRLERVELVLRDRPLVE